MIRPGSTKATNNNDKYLSLKVSLRIDALNNSEHNNILECFAGDSVIWNKVKNITKKTFTIYKIDANEKYKVDYCGNALKYLKNNSINNYNIIDLDSWGSPVKYLEHIFKTNFKGTVLCTYCSPISLNPDKILANNFYGHIYAKSKKKSILAKDIGIMFKQYLLKNNIKEYKGLISKKIIYCSFKI
jgi:hypothetical protein